MPTGRADPAIRLRDRRPAHPSRNERTYSQPHSNPHRAMKFHLSLSSRNPSADCGRMNRDNYSLVQAKDRWVFAGVLIKNSPRKERKIGTDPPGVFTIAIRKHRHSAAATSLCKNEKSPPDLSVEQGQIGGWEFAMLSFPRWPFGARPFLRGLPASRRYSPRQAESSAS